jgi:hypothetical protein
MLFTLLLILLLLAPLCLSDLLHNFTSVFTVLYSRCLQANACKNVMLLQCQSFKNMSSLKLALKTRLLESLRQCFLFHISGEIHSLITRFIFELDQLKHVERLHISRGTYRGTVR